MSPTISCTWPEFKRMAGEFFRACETANVEEAEAGFKCLSLAYIGMETSNELVQYQAQIVIQLASNKMQEILHEN